MKKKFLSLMMAAAVVATTSVSAFAADSNVEMPSSANVISSDATDGSAQVQINGNIQDQNGNDATGTFKVTVPTSANFTVNKNGALIGPTMTIKNEGSQKIEVLAQNFSSGTGAIKIISEDKIKADKAKGSSEQEYSRNTISLKLMGEFKTDGAQKVAYLGASDAGNGVYGQPDLGTVSSNGVSLLTLEAGDSNATTGTIAIEGSAGPKTIQSAVSDNFTLTLRIKKVVNQ